MDKEWKKIENQLLKPKSKLNFFIFILSPDKQLSWMITNKVQFSTLMSH